MKRTSLIVFALAALAVSATATSASAAISIGATSPSYASEGGCPNCGVLQGFSAVATYNIPSDGVVTSFQVRTSTTAPTASDEVTYFASRFAGGSNYLMVHRSELVNFSGKPADSVVAFPVRAPVKAGDFTGLIWSTSTVTGTVTEPGAFASTAFAETTPVGNTFTLGGSFAARLNLKLTLEPDIDRDGFGDETQDLCPSNAQFQTTCPIPNTLDLTAPVISSLKLKFAKFLINPKGPVVATALSKGSTIEFNSSEPATVTIVVTRSSKSSRTGKTTVKKIQRFVRSAKLGANSVKYSGRYRDSKRVRRVLKPGKYKLTATPVDDAGNVGLKRSTSFTIAN